MPTPAQMLGTAVAAAGLGFVAGIVVWPRPSAAPRAEPATAEPAKSVVEAPTKPTPEAEANLAACARELEQTRSLLQLVAAPFPKQGPELAEAWTETLTRVSRECPLSPYEVVLTDCSEYPCLAGLRPTGAKPSWMPDAGPERFEMQSKLGAALRECPVLTALFGAGFSEGAIVVQPAVAACPGADEELWSVFVLDPRGPAFAYATQDDSTAREEAELERWAAARVGALASRWPCAEQATP